MADATSPLLEVDDLRVEFATGGGTVRAVNGVSFTVAPRQTLAILGESGSGKSVTAQAVMGIVDSPPGKVSGSVRLRGRDLFSLSAKQRDKVNGVQIALVFQDALSALNPVFSVGHQIAEVFRVHRGMKRRAAKAAAVELVHRVGIPAAAKRVDDYPHQFSGGMRQRIMIALAIALEPDVLIADEPTTALDVTVQAQIMELLADIQAESGMGLILITHDLGVVAEVATDVAVMYAGRIVERGTVHQIFARPAHPYTEGLLASMPRVDRGETGPRKELTAIGGTPPNLARPPSGCPFHPRCARARDDCAVTLPPLHQISTRLLPQSTAGDGRASACHYWKEVVADG